MHVRELYFLFKLSRGRWGSRKKGLAKKYPNALLRLRPQAKLLAAYQHYTLKRFSGRTSIICSAGREHLTKVWSEFLPQHVMHPINQSHNEVIRAAAGETARLMQSIFDNSLIDRGVDSATFHY